MGKHDNSRSYQGKGHFYKGWVLLLWTIFTAGQGWADENPFFMATGAYPLANPARLTFLDDGKTFTVLNRLQEGRLTLFSITDKMAVKEASTGSMPYDVIAGSGNLYISNYGSATLLVLSQADLAEITTVPLNDGPSYMAMSDDGARLFVSCAGADIIETVNTTSFVIEDPLYDERFNLIGKLVAEDGKLFVANNGHSSIVVLAQDTGERITVINLPGVATDMGVVGTKMYVSARTEEAIYLIDLTTLTLLDKTIDMAGTPGDLISDGERYVYVLNSERRGAVFRLDARSDLLVEDWFFTSAQPEAGVLSPDGAILLVANKGDATVSYNYVEGELSLEPIEVIKKPGESVVLSVSGGSGRYEWKTPAGTLSAADGAMVTYTAPAMEGIFNVVVTDRDSDAKVEAVISVIDLRLSPETITVSNRDPILFTVTGGTPPFEFYTPQGTIDASTTRTCAYTPPESAGEYYIEVTDKNNHRISAAITYLTTPLGLSPDRVTMAPGAVNGFTVSGGMAPYTVTYGEGECDDCSDLTAGAAFYFTASAHSGESFVRVFDSTGASVMAVISVYEGLFLSPAHLYAPVGQKVSLDIVGGTSPYRVQCDSGECALEGQKIAYMGQIISEEKDVALTVFDNENKQFTARITVAGAFSVSPLTIVSSRGETHRITVAGGTGPYIYQAGAGELQKIDENVFLYTAPLTFGDFDIDFQDHGGAVKTVSVNTINDHLIVSPSQIILYPGASIALTVIGGSAPYRFAYEKGHIETSGEKSILTAPEDTGDYTVEVFDQLGGSFGASVSVVAPIMLNPSVQYMNPGEIKRFTVTGGAGEYQFAVESGTLTATHGPDTIYEAPQRTGRYWMRVTDGLSNTATSLIVVGGIPRISPAYVYKGRNQEVTFKVTGGFPPYAISVDSGSPPMEIGQGLYEYVTSDVVGVYQVTVNDARGGVDQLLVEVGATDISITPSVLTVMPGQTAELVIDGGLSPYQVSSEIGSLSLIGQSRYIFEAPEQAEIEGDYAIKLEDASGKKASAIVSVGKGIAAPDLILTIEGITTTFTWNAVSGAAGYRFCFDFALPDTDFEGDYLECLDLGNLSGSIPVPLWSGASFFVGIEAYAENGAKAMSDAALLRIP